MFGEPADNPHECNARLFIGDDYGDNTATMRCRLAPHHDGLHTEQFERKGGLVTITWVTDERERCDHDCGQWRDAHDSETVQCPKDADDHEYSDCAYCHPGDPAQTCAACGKTYYYEAGHDRRCTKKSYMCEICGQSGLGLGPHHWPRCPGADTLAGEPV